MDLTSVTRFDLGFVRHHQSLRILVLNHTSCFDFFLNVPLVLLKYFDLLPEFTIERLPKSQKRDSGGDF